MNEELRNALERAAGEDPHTDLTEMVWAQGRRVRRRRHAAQAAGGIAAAGVLVGAVFLGGGLLEPEAHVGPAVPTVQEEASSTVALPTTELETTPPDPTPIVDLPTGTQEATGTDDVSAPVPEESPAPEDGTPVPPPDEPAEPTDPPPALPPTTQPPDPTTEPPVEPPPSTEPPSTPPQEDVITLSLDSVDGVPLSGPTPDLVAAVTARLGEPFSVVVDEIGGCSGDEVFSLYNWDGFLLHVQGADGPEAERHWDVNRIGAVLPNGVRLGMTMEEVQSLDTLTEIPAPASPHYRLGSGVVVSFGEDGTLASATDHYEVC